MDDIIRTENVSKRYGCVKAVDGVSISVRKGEIYGFLGLNGAGKTTTIRMLLGMVKPTSGYCSINGQRINTTSHDLWHHVGYLVETPSAYPELTVWENLEIIRRMRLLRDNRSVDWVIDRLRLGPYRDRCAKNLSLGNAQRLGLAKAIMHEPDILILDEPANGLDPAGIVEIRGLLSDLAKNHQVTIFISSHLLGEIAKFATRIGIIHHGKLIQESDTEQLNELVNRTLVIAVEDTEGAVSALESCKLGAITAGNGMVRVTGKKAIKSPAEVNTFLVNSGYPPTMVKIDEEDLESYFLRVIGTNEGMQ
ncbi:MAG: ABC transporter ATP-binding protein [Chitinivibrionales bacterium]|nr:ABC transporter ATP-binding protein [Chitinivibrionales bacterium]